MADFFHSKRKFDHLRVVLNVGHDQTDPFKVPPCVSFVGNQTRNEIRHSNTGTVMLAIGCLLENLLRRANIKKKSYSSCSSNYLPIFGGW